MTIVLTSFAEGTLCQGCAWTVANQLELAERIAFVALGQSRHVAKILSGIKAIPPSTTVSTRAASIKLLTVPPGTDPWHRDGWLFQTMSWLAALQANPSAIIRAPHMILAHKGFDGLQLELDVASGIVTAAVIFEDKPDRSAAVKRHLGPSHRATLLQAVAREFPSSALVQVNPPSGISAVRWRSLIREMAKQRPYVWRNHREAIGAGYLETGISAAVSFPTGGGKSRLAELKIAAALLRGVKVIFLAPTLALVDQTAKALTKTFPQAQVQRERAEELVFSPIENEPLPGISVLTPERCLAMLSFSSDVFEDIGLIVFDECHLLHPRNMDTSRRSIDAMLCLLNLNRLASTADILLLSAMMKNTAEMAGWLQDLTGRTCLGLDLRWKPTRQVRGCVVYASERLDELRTMLGETRRAVPTRTLPPRLSEA